jgi:hypothetical protein
MRISVWLSEIKEPDQMSHNIPDTQWAQVIEKTGGRQLISTSQIPFANFK